MTVPLATTVSYDAQGAPKASPPSGTVTELGAPSVGTLELTVEPSRALGPHAIVLTSPRGELAPGAMTTLGVAEAFGGYVTTAVREAGNGSQPAAIPLTLAALARSGYPEASLWAAGSIVWIGDQPRWLWQSGAFAPLTPVEPGLVELDFWPGRGIGPERAAVLVTTRDVLEPGRMAAVAATVTADGTMRISTSRFGQGPSERVPVPLDVVVLGPPRQDPPLDLHGLGAVRLDGNTVGWAHQSGVFEAIVVNGPGDWTLKLAPGAGLHARASALLACPHGLSANRLRGVGVVHVSATEKRLTLLEQAPNALGGERTDFGIDLALVSLPGPVPLGPDPTQP